MKAKRKIAVLSGKRGGFGALIPFFEAAQNDPEVDLWVVVTDMHLSDAFGHTLKEVQKWVKNVVQVPMDQQGSTPVDRAVALGRALSGIAKALHELQPDVFVVLGDRGETLAAVTAATHLGIPIAHIQGGDLSGNVDEVMRHAITKMAHVHFPSIEDSAERLRKMGEEPWRIFVVGDSHIDRIVAGEYTPAAEVRRRYDIGPDAPFVLVLFHPETLFGEEKSRLSMQAIMEEVTALNMRTLVVYPCSDHGYQGILQVIDRYSAAPGVSVHKNIDAVDFWGLQSQAVALVGNSSAGLIEAPYFNLPVVNVGSRQQGRLRWRNVIDVEADNPALREALRKAQDPAFRAMLKAHSDKPYGDGKSYLKMLEALKGLDMGPRLIQKRMTY